MNARGFYHYTYATGVYPTLKLQGFLLRVEIIGESKTQYRVKYLAYHQNNKGPGTITWVHKNKVTIDGEARTPEVKKTRLPYKDN